MLQAKSRFLMGTPTRPSQYCFDSKDGFSGIALSMFIERFCTVACVKSAFESFRATSAYRLYLPIGYSAAARFACYSSATT